MISFENASPMPFALRYCSPVTPVASNNPTRSTASPKLFHGNTGSSYIWKNLPTALFINLFVQSGAAPYLHSSFALSHQVSPAFVTITNSRPFQMPRSGMSIWAARSCPAADRLNSSMAFTIMRLLCTKIEPPNSTEIVGSFHGFTVVVRPPM